MLQASSSGNGLHSIRSINVRANLLSEWTTDQVRFRGEAIRYGLMILGALLLTLVSIPLLESGRQRYTPTIRIRESDLGGLKSALAEADRAKKVSEPEVDSAQVIGQTHGYFNRFVGELDTILNSANSGMVLSSIRIEVRAAEILIDCKANAATFEAAQAFATAAGKGSHKVSALASIRPDPTFDANGITFNYLKRVEAK